MFKFVTLCLSIVAAFLPGIANCANAKRNESPYTVILQTRFDDAYFCTGTILDETHILTTADCVQSRSYVDLYVQYGIDQIYPTNFKNTINITNVDIPNDYSIEDEFQHNIAVVTLKNKIVFSDYARAMSLPDQDEEIPAGTNVVLTGFTRVLTGHNNILTRVIDNMKIYSYNDCINLVPDQLCAGPISPNASVIAYYSGALFVDRMQVGIANQQFKDQVPILAVKVPKYSNWIKETLRKQSKQFPYMVSVQDKSGHICTGSILDATHILTLAECAKTNLYIQYGLATIDVVQKKNRIQVSKVAVHESYSSNDTSKNNVAVLTLKDKIKFSTKAKAITLPEEGEEYPIGAEALLPTFTSKTTDVLQLKIFPDFVCQIETLEQICSGVDEGETFKSAKGGILYTNGKQIGIAYDNLVHQKTVFEKVSVYTNWIRKQIPLSPDDYPYIVSLQAGNRNDICTASILDETHVLTLAGCVPEGGDELQIQYDTADSLNKIQVSKVVRHGDFFQNIAVLTLARSMLFSDKARPIRIPDQDEATPIGSNAVLAGITKRETTFVKNMTIYPDDSCTFYDVGEICTGVQPASKYESGRGGALIANGQQIGVAYDNFARPKTIFVNVSYHSNWIQEQMSPSDFPYIVSIQHPSDFKHLCSGSILDETHVLTTYDCFLDDARDFYIQYGIDKIDSANKRHRIQMADVVVSNSVDPYSHKIAIVTLKEKMKLSNFARPITLPEQDEAPPVGSAAQLVIFWNDMYIQPLKLFPLNDCEITSSSPEVICSGRADNAPQVNQIGGVLYANNKQVGVSYEMLPTTKNTFQTISPYTNWIKSVIKN